MIDCDLPKELIELDNLKTLVYRKAGEIPDIIGELSQITTLDIQIDENTNSPKAIEKLKNLNTLNLYADVFYNFIGNLTNLKDLTLHSNKRESITIPNEILNLTKLERLGLTHFNEVILPENLSTLKNVQYLNLLASYTITNIEAICDLENLEEINFDFVQLKYLPEKIGNLKKLKSLKLKDQNFTFPESFGNMSGLKKIELNGGEIGSIPESFTNLENLEEIDFQYAKISKLPESFGNLKKLKKLRISKSGIAQLPDSIGNCLKLEKIIIEDNNITSLPESICNLSNLKHLDIGINDIISLPENIGNLKKLQTFCGTGYLKSIPDSFKNLIELKHIELDRTGFKKLPDYFANFCKLEKINLEHSWLEVIPAYFLEFKNLKELNLNGVSHIISFPEELFYKENLKIIGYKPNTKDDFRRPENILKKLKSYPQKDNNINFCIAYIENYAKVSNEIEVYLDNDACDDEDFNEDFADFLRGVVSNLEDLNYVKFRTATTKKLKDLFTEIAKNNNCNIINIYGTWSLPQKDIKFSFECADKCCKSEAGTSVTFPDFEELNKLYKEAENMEESENYVLSQFKEITLNKFYFIFNDLINELILSKFLSNLNNNLSFVFNLTEKNKKPQQIFEYNNPNLEKENNSDSSKTKNQDTSKSEKIDLSGKKVCLTGKAPISREEVEKILTERGAIVQSSVNKQTDILICGDEDTESSKAKKAREQGVQILTYKDVLNFL